MLEHFEHFIVLMTVMKDMKRPTRNYRSQMRTESKLSLIYLDFFKFESNIYTNPVKTFLLSKV